MSISLKSQANSQFGLDAFLQSDQNFYDALIQDLMIEVEAKSPLPKTFELAKARLTYFTTALKKSVDLAKLPPEIEYLDAKALTVAAQELPDKKGPGWDHQPVAMTPEIRAQFTAAAQARSKEMRWDNLFEPGQQDILLPFAETAQSYDGKLKAYFARYNEAALQRFEQASARDAAAIAKNPETRASAGKTIEQRQIWRDPGDPGKLQTLNPHKNQWEPGPKLGKFLQDEWEWGLFDDLSRENDKQHAVAAGHETQQHPTLRSFAHKDNAPTRVLLEAGDLRVLVSRDPQKIGEMSTGQRWRSCMNAADGINRHYVPKDIQAGSLVAYVVHKDDPQARYPFMRQLIKPFRNEAGETILVPANKIYGGDGQDNSATRDGLTQTLNSFVARQNAGKDGAFHMDPDLYTDGQNPTVMLQGDWTPQGLLTSLQKYQEGGLQEWLTELQQNLEYKKNGRRGAHGEDPAINIKKLRNKIRNVMDRENTDSGIARMMYRETAKSSIGSLPDPRLIHEAALSDTAAVEEGKAFKALTKGNTAQWEALSAAMRPDTRLRLALLASTTVEDPTGAASIAISDQIAAMLNGIEDQGERSQKSFEALNHPATTLNAQEKIAAILIADAPFQTIETRLVQMDRINALMPTNNSLERVRADEVIFDSIPELAETDKQVRRLVAIHGAHQYAQDSTLADRAVTRLSGIVTEIGPQAGIKLCYETLQIAAGSMRSMLLRQGLDILPQLERDEQLDYAVKIAGRANRDADAFEAIILNAAANGQPTYKSTKALLSILQSHDEAYLSDNEKAAREAIVKSLPDLSPNERFELGLMALRSGAQTPNLFERGMLTTALEAFGQLSPEDRFENEWHIRNKTYDPQLVHAGDALLLDAARLLPDHPQQGQKLLDIQQRVSAAGFPQLKEATENELLARFSRQPAHVAVPEAIIALGASSNQTFRDKTLEIARDGLPGLEIHKRASIARAIMDAAEPESPLRQEMEAFAQHAVDQKAIYDKIQRAIGELPENYSQAQADHSATHATILDNMPKLDTDSRALLAAQILQKGAVTGSIYTRMKDMLGEDLDYIINPETRYTAAASLITETSGSPELADKAGKTIVTCHLTPLPASYATKLKYTIAHATKDSPIQVRAFERLLPLLAQDRYDTPLTQLSDMSRRLDADTVIYERCANMVLDLVEGVPAHNSHAHRILRDSKEGTPVRERATKIFFDNEDALPGDVRERASRLNQYASGLSPGHPAIMRMDTEILALAREDSASDKMQISLQDAAQRHPASSPLRAQAVETLLDAFSMEDSPEKACETAVQTLVCAQGTPHQSRAEKLARASIKTLNLEKLHELAKEIGSDNSYTPQESATIAFVKPVIESQIQHLEHGTLRGTAHDLGRMAQDTLATLSKGFGRAARHEHQHRNPGTQRQHRNTARQTRDNRR